MSLAPPSPGPPRPSTGCHRAAAGAEGSPVRPPAVRGPGGGVPSGSAPSETRCLSRWPESEISSCQPIFNRRIKISPVTNVEQ